MCTADDEHVHLMSALAGPLSCLGHGQAHCTISQTGIWYACRRRTGGAGAQQRCRQQRCDPSAHRCRRSTWQTCSSRSPGLTSRCGLLQPVLALLLGQCALVLQSTHALHIVPSHFTCCKQWSDHSFVAACSGVQQGCTSEKGSMRLPACSLYGGSSQRQHQLQRQLRHSKEQGWMCGRCCRRLHCGDGCVQWNEDSSATAHRAADGTSRPVEVR